MSEDEKEAGRIKGIARRLLRDSDEDKDLKGDAKEFFNSILSTGDKAKTELLKALAREFRQYLTEMGVDRDIRHLLLNYSLDINASLSLKRKDSDAETSSDKGSEDNEDSKN